MNKPQIRFDGFSAKWEEEKLSKLMDFSNGINATKESYGKGRKMISVMDILAENPISYNNIISAVEVDEKIESKNKVKSGDLVFVRSSEVAEDVGWSKAYLDEEYALYSGFSIRGKKKNRFDSSFLQRGLNSKGRKQIESKAGGSTRFNVSQAILNSVAINMPEFNEQTEIGTFFDMLDAMIVKRRIEHEKIKNFKKAMLGKMFPKEGSKIPEIRFDGFCGEWEEKHLKEIINSEFKGKAKAEMQGNQSEYLDAERLNGGLKRKVDCKTDTVETDVLILWDGSQAGTVYHGFNGALGSTLKAYKTSEYGEFVFQQLKKNQQLIYDKYRTPNIPHVVKTFTEDFLMYIPIYEEQIAIGNFFKNLDETILLQKKQIEHLQNIKKSLLEKMFI